MIKFSTIEKMADLLRESSNLLDDLLKDLEDWEAILSSLPDFGADQNQNEIAALAINQQPNAQ